jgi:hypothetical protein
MEFIRRAKYSDVTGWYTICTHNHAIGIFEGDDGTNYSDMKIDDVEFLDKKYGWLKRFLNWIW